MEKFKIDSKTEILFDKDDWKLVEKIRKSLSNLLKSINND